MSEVISGDSGLVQPPVIISVCAVVLITSAEADVSAAADVVSTAAVVSGAVEDAAHPTEDKTIIPAIKIPIVFFIIIISSFIFIFFSVQVLKETA